MSVKNPKFVVKKAADNRFYFNLHAANGQIIATSPMYATPDAVKRSIKAVKSAVDQIDNNQEEHPVEEDF